MKKRAAYGPPFFECQASHRLMLPEIADMIETAGLQIGARDRDFWNEADVLVFAGGNARDDFAPGNLGIDNGLTPAPSIVDHHNEILHGGAPRPRKARGDWMQSSISENQK